MKIATAIYDRNGVLISPINFYQGNHPTKNQFTTDSGYWHRVDKAYPEEYTRDLTMLEMMNRVEDLNGTCVMQKYWAQKYLHDPGCADPADEYIALREGYRVTTNRNQRVIVAPGAATLPFPEGAEIVDLHHLSMVYVIEEPDHVPFRRFAATVDRLGVDPNFEYPADGVAQYGPDYRTPHQQKIAEFADATGDYERLWPIPPAIDHVGYGLQTANKHPAPPRINEPQFG